VPGGRVAVRECRALRARALQHGYVFRDRGAAELRVARRAGQRAGRWKVAELPGRRKCGQWGPKDAAAEYEGPAGAAEALPAGCPEKDAGWVFPEAQRASGVHRGMAREGRRAPDRDAQPVSERAGREAASRGEARELVPLVAQKSAEPEIRRAERRPAKSQRAVPVPEAAEHREPTAPRGPEAEPGARRAAAAPREVVRGPAGRPGGRMQVAAGSACGERDAPSPPPPVLAGPRECEPRDALLPPRGPPSRRDAPVRKESARERHFLLPRGSPHAHRGQYHPTPSLRH